MDRRANLPGTTQGPHSTPTPETPGWGDGSIKYNPSGVRVCPPWLKGQAGRWASPDCVWWLAEVPSATAARARTLRKGRPGASPPSLRDERDARCKRLPRPNGRRTHHTPRGADVSRTHPVSPRRSPSGRRDVASGDGGPARCPALESSPFGAGRMSTAISTRSSRWRDASVAVVHVKSRRALLGV